MTISLPLPLLALLVSLPVLAGAVEKSTGAVVEPVEAGRPTRAGDAITLWIHNDAAVPKKQKRKNKKKWVDRRLLDYQVERTPGQIVQKIVRHADDIADTKKVLEEVLASSATILNLAVITHKGKGSRDIMDKGSFDQIESIKNLSSIFLPGADIYFRPTDIGTKVLGVEFMLDVGKTFLEENGGTLRAPTAYFLNTPLIDPKIAWEDHFRAIIFESGGDEFSMPGFEDMDKARERIRQAIGRLSARMGIADLSSGRSGIRSYLSAATVAVDISPPTMETLLTADVYLEYAQLFFDRFKR